MTNLLLFQEEKLKDKPGYEHLNEPLHVLVEAEFPEDTIDARLDHAVAILEDLLKPVVCTIFNMYFYFFPILKTYSNRFLLLSQRSFPSRMSP